MSRLRLICTLRSAPQCTRSGIGAAGALKDPPRRRLRGSRRRRRHQLPAVAPPRRLKQQLAQAQASLPSTDELAAAAAAAVGTARSALPAPTASSEAASPVKQDANGEQQYLRLPVESAKKLRWFDRQDINSE